MHQLHVSIEEHIVRVNILWIIISSNMHSTVVDENDASKKYKEV